MDDIGDDLVEVGEWSSQRTSDQAAVLAFGGERVCRLTTLSATPAPPRGV
jgi:hypothetical protein